MPHLAWYVDNFSPFFIEFGRGIGIRYYGLSYALGYLFLYVFLRQQVKWGWCSLTREQADALVLWICLLGVFVGGRLGYCLLYDFPETIRHPWTLFFVWEGGMASHGGIIGVILVMVWFARSRKVPFWNVADATALCTPVGLGLGRIANFINGELWGRPTTVPWAVYFPRAPLVNEAPVPRHPSSLYEAALEGLLLFLLLLWIRKGTRRDGVVAISFLALYSLFRIIAECFREPDIQIGYYLGFATQGQLLSATMLVAAGVLAWVQFWKQPRSLP